MNYEIKAADWKAKGAGKYSLAGGLAGGVWLFVFKSSSAQCTAVMAFLGMGLGFGLELKFIKEIKTALSGPLFIDGEGNSIQCERAFSASSLNGKFGLITSVGAAGGVGYGAAAISAYSFSKNYFKNQTIHGWSAGVGVSAISASGTWWHVSNPRKIWVVTS